MKMQMLKMYKNKQDLEKQMTFMVPIQSDGCNPINMDYTTCSALLINMYFLKNTTHSPYLIKSHRV